MLSIGGYSGTFRSTPDFPQSRGNESGASPRLPLQSKKSMNVMAIAPSKERFLLTSRFRAVFQRSGTFDLRTVGAYTPEFIFFTFVHLPHVHYIYLQNFLLKDCQ